MRGVEIDAVAQTARVQAGTLWLEVTEAATPHGLFPLSGSSPDVGVVGYTLGGGLSWLARKHGLAANHVTAIELVTPDGELRARDRGGPRRAVLGAPRRRRQLRRRHRDGVPPLPLRRGLRRHDAVAVRAPRRAAARVARVDADARRRRSRRRSGSSTSRRCPSCRRSSPGRSVVVVDGAYAGGAEEGAAAIAALRALAPEMDTWAPSSPAVLSRIHMDPEEPIPYLGAGALLGELDDDALDGVRRAAPAGRAGPVRRAAPPGRRGRPRARGRRRGRAARRRVPHVRRRPGHGTGERGAPPRRASSASRPRWPRTRPGKDYLNFVEHPTDTSRFYADEDYARLRAIRAAVDPDGRMVGNHPIRGRPAAD